MASYELGYFAMATTHSPWRAMTDSITGTDCFHPKNPIFNHPNPKTYRNHCLHVFYDLNITFLHQLHEIHIVSTIFIKFNLILYLQHVNFNFRIINPLLEKASPTLTLNDENRRPQVFLLSSQFSPKNCFT